jgi:hypothetical protein
MPLLDLPNELVQDISEYLKSERDINAIAQANRRLYCLLDSYLYRYNVQQSGSSALLWAARHGQEATAQKAIRDVGTEKRREKVVVLRELQRAIIYTRELSKQAIEGYVSTAFIVYSVYKGARLTLVLRKGKLRNGMTRGRSRSWCLPENHCCRCRRLSRMSWRKWGRESDNAFESSSSSSVERCSCVAGQALS